MSLKDVAKVVSKLMPKILEREVLPDKWQNSILQTRNVLGVCFEVLSCTLVSSLIAIYKA